MVCAAGLAQAGSDDEIASMAARLKPARIEHVVDGLRLRAQLSAAYQAEGENARATVKHLLHGALFRGRMIAKERLEAGENGLAVARFLEEHPRVEKVYYPGLESHRDHAEAKKYMRGYGGLVTFLVKNADWRATADVVDRSKLCRIAPSLGGVESLIEQPLVMSYYQRTPEERKAFGIPDNMIRLACGIEDAADLIADLEQALRA